MTTPEANGVAQPVNIAPERLAHLLDREVPADYRKEWTARIAAPLEVTTPGSASVIVFRLGSEWLALPVAIFQEMAEPTVVHVLPHRRSGNLLGLVNVRGELLLCVSLAGVLGLATAESANSGLTKKPRLLVLDSGGSRLACPVDEVFGTVRFHPRELLDPPSTLSKTASVFTQGLLPWSGKHVGVLNERQLFETLDRSFS